MSAGSVRKESEVLTTVFLIVALTNHGWKVQPDLGFYRTLAQCEAHLGTQPGPLENVTPQDAKRYDLFQKGTKRCVRAPFRERS